MWTHRGSSHLSSRQRRSSRHRPSDHVFVQPTLPSMATGWRERPSKLSVEDALDAAPATTLLASRWRWLARLGRSWMWPLGRRARPSPQGDEIVFLLATISSAVLMTAYVARSYASRAEPEPTLVSSPAALTTSPPRVMSAMSAPPLIAEAGLIAGSEGASTSMSHDGVSAVAGATPPRRPRSAPRKRAQPSILEARGHSSARPHEPARPTSDHQAVKDDEALIESSQRALDRARSTLSRTL